MSPLANNLRRVIGDMVLFTRIGAGYCPICEWDHVNDNTYFAIAHDQVVRLHCQHSEQHCGKKTTLVLGYLDSSNWLSEEGTADKIPEVFEQQNINNRTTPQINFDKAKGAARPPDTLLIKSPMATGKTKSLLDYLNSNQVPKDARLVYVSFSKSFTSEVLKKLGGGFVNYQEVDGQIDDKVIVQYKSLIRLKLHDLNKTILILDEAKSILTQIESLQTNNYDNIFLRWIVFDDLIKLSAKVIAMDADTGFCTYEFLASSCKHVWMINNLWTPPPEEAPIDMYYDKPEAFFAAVVAAAPIAVVSTSQTQAEVLHKHFLEACPDAVIKKYNLDSSAADWKDVRWNTSWFFIFSKPIIKFGKWFIQVRVIFG